MDKRLLSLASRILSSRWTLILAGIIVGTSFGISLVPLWGPGKPIVDWTAVGSIFAGFAVLFALLTVHEQREGTRQSGVWALTTSLLTEWRLARPKRKEVYMALETTGAVPSRGFDGIPCALGDAAEDISNFLDLVGWLYCHKLVDPEMLLGYLGPAIVSAGDKLGPFVAGERSVRQLRNHQAYFEHLCAHCKGSSKNLYDQLATYPAFQAR